MHLNSYKPIFPFLLALICLAMLGSSKSPGSLIIAENCFECEQPFDMPAQVSGTSVSISWGQINDAEGWEILVGVKGFIPRVDTSIIEHNTTAAQPILTTNLPGGIPYDASLRALCSAGLSGPLSGAFRFLFFLFLK